MSIAETGKRIDDLRNLYVTNQPLPPAIEEELAGEITDRIAKHLAEQKVEDLDWLCRHLGPLIQTADAFGSHKIAGRWRGFSYIASLYRDYPQSLERHRWFNHGHPKGKILRAISMSPGIESSGIAEAIELPLEEAKKHLATLEQTGFVARVVDRFFMGDDVKKELKQYPYELE